MKNLILLLLLVQPCFAEETFLGYGIGLTNNQNFQVGRIEDIYGGLYVQGEAGYWKQNYSHSSIKSGLYATFGLGLELNLNSFEIRGALGPTFISNPDSQIEGYFPKLDTQLYGGYRFSGGEGVGLQLESVNGTKNFITFQISKQW